MTNREKRITEKAKQLFEGGWSSLYSYIDMQEDYEDDDDDDAGEEEDEEDE